MFSQVADVGGHQQDVDLVHTPTYLQSGDAPAVEEGSEADEDGGEVHHKHIHDAPLCGLEVGSEGVEVLHDSVHAVIEESIVEQNGGHHA